MKITLRLLVLVSLVATLGVGCAKKEAMDNAIEGTSVEQSNETTVEESTESSDSEEMPAEEPNIDTDTDDTSTEEDGTDDTTEE